MAKKKKKQKQITKTEIELTLHSTIVALNLQKLLRTYNDLAHQNEVIPSPSMQAAIESSIEGLSQAIARKQDLANISLDVAKRITQLTELTTTK